MPVVNLGLSDRVNGLDVENSPVTFSQRDFGWLFRSAVYPKPLEQNLTNIT
jgi:hypothetical protein